MITLFGQKCKFFQFLVMSKKWSINYNVPKFVSQNLKMSMVCARTFICVWLSFAWFVMICHELVSKNGIPDDITKVKTCKMDLARELWKLLAANKSWLKVSQNFSCPEEKCKLRKLITANISSFSVSQKVQVWSLYLIDYLTEIWLYFLDKPKMRSEVFYCLHFYLHIHVY